MPPILQPSESLPVEIRRGDLAPRQPLYCGNKVRISSRLAVLDPLERSRRVAAAEPKLLGCREESELISESPCLEVHGERG